MKKYLKVTIFALVIIACFSKASADGPLSEPGIPRWSATTGFVNPTIATFNGNAPMQCTASSTPSAAFAEQNRAAFQVALNQASSTGQWIYFPPCQVDVLNSNAPCTATSNCAYPLSRKTGSSCGVDLSGLSNINIVGFGALIRQFAPANGNSEFDMVCIKSTAHIKIIGMQWSQRDVSGSTTEQVHVLQIGNGVSVADDVLVYHNKFSEGVPQVVFPAVNKGGDCIRILGSSIPSTNTRINIIENELHCRRSSLGIQRGFQFVNFVGNQMSGVTDQDIDYEPTSEGLLHNMLATNNIFDRRQSPSDVAITMSGTSATSPSVGMVVADNVFIEGSVSGGLNVFQSWIRNNTMSSGISRADNNNNILLFRRVSDAWITNNAIYRGPNAIANDMVAIAHQLGNCAGMGPICHPESIWITGNRLEQHAPILVTAGSEAGVRLDSVLDAWVNENTMTYHAAAGDVNVNGPTGLDVQNTGETGSSGWFVDNRVTRGFQEDGVTLAGRILAGALFQVASQSIGHFTVRDNLVEGARSIMFSNANLLSQLPAGPTVFSGNVGSLVGSSTGEVIAGGLYTNENALMAERVAGPVTMSSSTQHTHITGGCAGDILSLPVCEVDGLIKTITADSVGCTSTEVVAIAGFGDGTSLGWALTAGQSASARLVCEAGTSTWWLLEKTSNITVNP